MILSDMRKRIDEIDDEILRLLNKRASIVTDIAAHKRICKLPVVDLDRYNAVLLRMAARNTGPLSNSAIQTFFSRMMFFFEDFEKRILSKEKS